MTEFEPEQTVSEALESLIQKGLAEVYGVDDEGELLYAATEKGARFYEAIHADELEKLLDDDS